MLSPSRFEFKFWFGPVAQHAQVATDSQATRIAVQSDNLDNLFVFVDITGFTSYIEQPVFTTLAQVACTTDTTHLCSKHYNQAEDIKIHSIWQKHNNHVNFRL